MSQDRNMSRRKFIQTSASVTLMGGATIVNLGAVAAAGESQEILRVPDRLVVLFFDDAVRSQRTFVAPFLRDLGFGASFFVCHEWMADHVNFMTWEEIAEREYLPKDR